MYKAVYQLKELGTFELFSQAFKVIYDAIKNEKVLLWQMLETTVWIEQLGTSFVYSFYEARDTMCKMGFLVDGKWVGETTPPELQHGREPDKVKPLAQYLDKYIEHEVELNNISPEVAELFAYSSWRELLEQALDAYQSTENVTIKIERNVE